MNNYALWCISLISFRTEKMTLTFWASVSGLGCGSRWSCWSWWPLTWAPSSSTSPGSQRRASQCSSRWSSWWKPSPRWSRSGRLTLLRLTPLRTWTCVTACQGTPRPPRPQTRRTSHTCLQTSSTAAYGAARTSNTRTVSPTPGGSGWTPTVWHLLSARPRAGHWLGIAAGRISSRMFSSSAASFSSAPSPSPTSCAHSATARSSPPS